MSVRATLRMLDWQYGKCRIHHNVQVSSTMFTHTLGVFSVERVIYMLSSDLSSHVATTLALATK